MESVGPLMARQPSGTGRAFRIEKAAVDDADSLAWLVRWFTSSLHFRGKSGLQYSVEAHENLSKARDQT
jgi:hypothetical protein